MPLTEAKIEAKINRFCKKHRIYCRKFKSASQRGVPDRIYAFNRKIVFVELKRPGNKPTALQLRELRLLTEVGIPATWADSYDKAIEVITKELGPFDVPLLSKYGGKLAETQVQGRSREIMEQFEKQAQDMIG